MRIRASSACLLRSPSSRDAYDHARILDAEAVGWDRGANSYTLPLSLKRAVEHASFFSDIAEVREPMTVLLSKVLNARCQSRKYGTVAEKMLLPSPQQTQRYEAATVDETTRAKKLPLIRSYQQMDQHRRDFSKMVLCSLLGNYAHCTTRASAAARPRIYALIEHFQAMLHQCSQMVVWCVRDYVVHVLLDDSALREQVGRVIRFDKFHALTDQVMTAVRTYLNQNIPYDWSQLGGMVHALPAYCNCLQQQRNNRRGHARVSVTPCTHAHHTWLHDMNQLLSVYHARLLEIAYPKPNTSEIAFLLSDEIRKRAPLVPRPGVVAAVEEVAYDSTDDDDDDVLRALSGRVEIRKLIQAKRDARAKRAAEAKQQGAVQCNFLHYLSQEQFDCLSFLVDTSDTLADVIQRMTASGFGLAPASATFIQKLLVAHRNGSVTKDARTRAVLQLPRRDPHAYNLVQVAAELLRKKAERSERIVGVLPVEAYDAQVRLLEARWKTPGCVEMTAACLFYCNVCGTVYSNVHQTHEKFYRYGLLNARTGLLSGNVYCRLNKVNHLGACQSGLPLSRVCIVGVRYSFAGKVYQLCVGCGEIMVPDYATCADAAELGGMLCCECTTAHRTAEQKQYNPTAAFLETLDRTCVCCGHRAQRAFLYPFNVTVCHRHHSRKMVEAITTNMPTTRAECVTTLVSLFTVWRTRKRERARPGEMRRLKAQRQRDRGRRC